MMNSELDESSGSSFVSDEGGDVEEMTGVESRACEALEALDNVGDVNLSSEEGEGSSGDEEEYEIERILRKRKDTDGQLWYKVVWKGDLFDPSYVIESDIDQVSREEFEEEWRARRARGEVEPRTESDEEWQSGEGESDIEVGSLEELGDDRCEEPEDLRPSSTPIFETIYRELCVPEGMGYEQATLQSQKDKSKGTGVTAHPARTIRAGKEVSGQVHAEKFRAIMQTVLNSVVSGNRSRSQRATPSSSQPQNLGNSESDNSSACSGGSAEVVEVALDMSKATPKTASTNSGAPVRTRGLSRNRPTPTTMIPPEIISPSPQNPTKKPKTTPTPVKPSSQQAEPPLNSLPSPTPMTLSSSSHPCDSEASPNIPSQAPIKLSSLRNRKRKAEHEEEDKDVEKEQVIQSIKMEPVDQGENIEKKVVVHPSQALLNILEHLKSCPTYITAVIRENNELHQLVERQTKLRNDAELKNLVLQKENEELKKESKDFQEERLKYAKLKATHADLKTRHAKLIGFLEKKNSEYNDIKKELMAPNPHDDDSIPDL